MIDKFYKIDTVLLFLWYAASIPIIYGDNTINPLLLVGFEAISILMILLTGRVILEGYKKPHISEFFISPPMIIWFIVITYRDFLTEYTMWLKIFYLSIDFASFLFLVDFFINILLFKISEKFPNLNPKKITDIVKLGILGISILVYSVMIREIAWMK